MRIGASNDGRAGRRNKSSGRSFLPVGKDFGCNLGPWSHLPITKNLRSCFARNWHTRKIWPIAEGGTQDSSSLKPHRPFLVLDFPEHEGQQRSRTSHQSQTPSLILRVILCVCNDPQTTKIRICHAPYLGTEYGSHLEVRARPNIEKQKPFGSTTLTCIKLDCFSRQLSETPSPTRPDRVQYYPMITLADYLFICLPTHDIHRNSLSA